MNSLFKRSMAMLLVIIMVIAIVPLTASAATTKATITVTPPATDGGNYTITANPSTVTLDTLESGDRTVITKDMILSADPEGYICEVDGGYLDNVPGASKDVGVIICTADDNMYYVGTAKITVTNDLEWADYTILATITNKADSTDTQTSTYSSATNTWSGSITLKKDATYKYEAELTPVTGSASTMIDGAASGDFTAAGVSFKVKFRGNPTNAVIRNSTTSTLTGTEITPSIKINGEEVDSSNSVLVASSTLKFYPFETATITMDEGCGYTNVSVASSGDGEASVSNNKLTYYIKLGGAQSQRVTLKFTGTGVADRNVTVTFTGLTTKPSVSGAILTGSGISTSANGSAKDKAFPVGKQGYFNVGSLVDYYSYMSTTQKSAISFSINKISDEYGEFTTSAKGSKINDRDAINGGTNIYYKAEKASKTDYDYIEIKVSISGVSTDQTATTKIYTGGNAGYDFDDYNSKTDVVKYVAKSSTDSYNKATAFTIEDFGKYLESYKESDYEDYYIMIDDEDDILLGTLYLGTSSSKGYVVDENDKITLDDIDKGYFRYCHTEEGVDQFEFTVYKASTKKAVSGSSGKTMWLVDDKSLIYGECFTHSLIHNIVDAATCTENGNIEFWYCSDCDKYYADAEATTPITLADTVIPALGHDYQGGSCTRCGESDAAWDPDAPRLEVCSVVGRPGDTVEVKIALVNNSGLTGLTTTVDFDASVLEYVSCQVNEQFGGTDSSYLSGSTLKTAWVTGDDAVTLNGAFLTIVFKVKDNAPDGDAVINLGYVRKNTIDANDEMVELLTVDGAVTVVNGIAGDINGDGEVTAVDARWLLQYLSGARELTEEQLLWADVNCDGEVTAVDARWILQYLSGARDENYQAK